jgi:hypothetical protein
MEINLGRTLVVPTPLLSAVIAQPVSTAICLEVGKTTIQRFGARTRLISGDCLWLINS